MRAISIAAIIILPLFLTTCGNKAEIRTIYWAGSSFNFRVKDTKGSYEFYLGYYIEVSDSGGAKIMKRERYKAAREYYRISISDSLKNEIFRLATTTSMFTNNRKSDEPSCIFDGYHCTLILQCDTTDRIISFIPPEGNGIQKRISHIMDSIWRNPCIEGKTTIDISKFEKRIENDALKTFGPLPKYMGTIKFTPPKGRIILPR